MSAAEDLGAVLETTSRATPAAARLVVEREPGNDELARAACYLDRAERWFGHTMFGDVGRAR
jgi:hypothetical protein